MSTDIQLHFQESGEGFPLILLHGNGENGSYFEHQIQYFQNKYRVMQSVFDSSCDNSRHTFMAIREIDHKNLISSIHPSPGLF